MCPETQNQKILAWLIDGHTLTSRQALDYFGVSRLAARINDLRERGWLIKSTRIRVTNRHGQRISVAQYKMGHQARNQGDLFNESGTQENQD